MNEPGSVVSEIARSNDVDASLLYRWRRKLAAEREATAFVPVRVFSELNEAGPTTAPIGASPPPPPLCSITVAFGAHVRLTIEGAPDSATLANVIGALAGVGIAPAMIAFPSGARVWLATGHTDMRKGFLAHLR